jgi:hypothetical protein
MVLLHFPDNFQIKFTIMSAVKNLVLESRRRTQKPFREGVIIVHYKFELMSDEARADRHYDLR